MYSCVLVASVGMGDASPCREFIWCRCGSGCVSDACCDVRVSDMRELGRCIVLSVLVCFVELADVVNGSCCRLVVLFGTICICVTAPTHTEQGHVVKAKGS